MLRTGGLGREPQAGGADLETGGGSRCQVSSRNEEGLWLTDGSCIRLRPLYRHHVWAYDFVADRTHDGRPLKMLTVLDEYSRECLAIVVTSQASGGRCSADAERAVCRARSTGESSLRQRSGVHGPSGSAVAR